MKALGWLSLLLASCANASDVVTIRMMAGQAWGIPPKEASDPRSLARRAIFEEFQKQHPHVRVVNAGGLELTGDRADSGFLMAMAGDTAPDVFYVNFRQYYNYIDQGFCRPLDDLVSREPSSIERVHPHILEVLRSYDGRIFAMPFYQVAQALYFRKDHFAEAGLNPNRPPQDWDEFLAYARALTESKPGRSGFSFSAGLGGKAYHWSNFVWQAGGEIVVPGEGGVWHSAVDSPSAAAALDFFRKLAGERWRGRDGREYGPAAQVSAAHARDIAEGRVSMWFSYTNDVMLNLLDIHPSVLGVAQMPAGPAGRANEINAGMWAIGSHVEDPGKLQACWEFIRFFADERAARVNTDRFVEMGLAMLVNPVYLNKFGYEDLAKSVDPAYVRANERLFETGKPEPYGRNCQQVYTVLDSALDRALLEPTTPASAILSDVAREMDRKLLGFTPEHVRRQQRAWAFGIALIVGAVAVVLTVRGVRRLFASLAVHERSLDRKKSRRVVRFVAACMAPAALSLLVWSYYPLVRGLVIAFQDYRIVKGATWVGLDNFIEVFTQPIFYKSVVNSFVYVALTLLIGFVLPIALALALTEIPRGRLLLRTLFYLPAMTSPIVIALLWRQFYDKSPSGLLNALIAPFMGWINTFRETMGWAPWPVALDWLGNPSLAMFAVVLPGVWAAAGPGSILYLAALKNIPDERYEAADMDGANWVSKLRYITLPGLRPLILINLLGTFIAGFKAMENIFVLTGGGPLYATHTMGLEVWTNAFMFLKFGYATAAAWVMGSILIGFTVVQVRSLLQVRFTTARL